jgi:uncharacterized membrane protein YgcG
VGTQSIYFHHKAVCHRLYNQIILCGDGDIILAHCCNNVFTKKVFPHDVGPDTLAVKGCLKTKAFSLRGGGRVFDSGGGGSGVISGGGVNSCGGGGCDV